jgi:hypothetical protein
MSQFKMAMMIANIAGTDTLVNHTEKAIAEYKAAVTEEEKKDSKTSLLVNVTLLAMTLKGDLASKNGESISERMEKMMKDTDEIESISNLHERLKGSN